MVEPVGVFTFRRLVRDDFGLLSTWLAEPHVARWWHHDPSLDSIEEDFGDTIDGLEPAEDFVATLDGEPIGVIQYCHFMDYPEYVAEMAGVYPVGAGAVSIDYLIGDPANVGRGIGRALIAAFVERIWATDPLATHIVVPVHSDNPASWRALLRAGFRLVAQGELEPDNPVDDRRHEILRLDRAR